VALPHLLLTAVLRTCAAAAFVKPTAANPPHAAAVAE